MMCTPETPWRLTRDTTQEAFAAELAATPIAPECDTLYDDAYPLGRLYLAHSFCENRHDTVGILITPDMHNNLALRPRGYPEETGQRNGFATFASYAGCLAAWRRRLVDPNLCYVPAVALLAYCECYNPAGDTHPVTGRPNDPARYCDELLATINRLPPEGESVPDLVFGNVPHPAYTKDILAPGVRADGDGWNSMNRDRRNFGVVYHRTVGRSIAGTGEWFRTPGSGLTHYGVGSCPPDAGPDGKIYQWVDPRSRVSPWASGPWENPPGDGRALVAKYGVEAINGDLIAIETSGRYDDPMSDVTRDTIAALSAYWADQAEVPWDGYPMNPHTGLVFTYFHSEFQAHKPCPGSVIAGAIDDLIARTTAILKEYQMAATPPPTVRYPPTWDAETAAAVWGDRYEQYRYNESGVISTIWREAAICSPLVYHELDSTDGRESFNFASGHVIGRLNDSEAYRVLSAPES